MGHAACPKDAQNDLRQREMNKVSPMPSLFWSGKLTLPMKLLVNANNVLSFFIGKPNDVGAMKDRVKLGYDGAFSDHVQHFDQLGYHFQDRAARVQLEGACCKGNGHDYRSNKLQVEKLSSRDNCRKTGAKCPMLYQRGHSNLKRVCLWLHYEIWGFGTPYVSRLIH
jgi:hypothetical protein